MTTLSSTLDRFDLAILDILQSDNTTPQRVIAQAVNLSAPAVQRRIQRLKDSGVIRANVAVLDPVKVGKPLTIVLEVHLENERPDRTAPLRARIAAEEAVQQCYSVTGEADYLMVVTVASMAEYDALPGIGHACGHNMIASAAYATAWKPKGDTAARTATVRVLHAPTRKVVSHFNKATKGRIVRSLLEADAAPGTPAELVEVLRDLGYVVETGAKAGALDVLVDEIH